MLELIPLANLIIQVAQPLEAGPSRRIVPILGGTFEGPRLRGIVLPGGADFQFLRPDGVTELEARYILQCEDGARVYVENRGLRHGPPEAMERLRRGEPVDPAEIYFRATPRFETSDPRYAWLTRIICLCDGVRRPDCVELSFFEVR